MKNSTIKSAPKYNMFEASKHLLCWMSKGEGQVYAITSATSVGTGELMICKFQKIAVLYFGLALSVRVNIQKGVGDSSDVRGAYGKYE